MLISLNRKYAKGSLRRPHIHCTSYSHPETHELSLPLNPHGQYESIVPPSLTKQRPTLRYAIVSDTHLRPRGESSSPWKTNLLTNDRARWGLDAVNRSRPGLVLHLGDP